MTDQTSNETATAAPDVNVVVEPDFLQKIVIKHPRLSKVVAIIGATLAVAGTAVTVNTVRKNKHHLDAAADDAKSAVSELSAAVSPSSENTNA